MLAPYYKNQLAGQYDSMMFQENYSYSFSQLACDAEKRDTSKYLMCLKPGL